MTALLAILIAIGEVSAAHLFDPVNYEMFVWWQIEMALIAAAGLMAKPTQRDRSILSVMVLWFAWIAASDWAFNYIPPVFVQYESMILLSLVLWATARPYFYTSTEPSGENVFIGFYRGPRAPFLSSLAALLGLPFSSMIIVAGETVLRSSGNGKMVINKTSALSKGDYVFVDTGVIATPQIFDSITRVIGKPTQALGVFRTKCVLNCEPVLERINIKPTSWLHRLPSIFYYQVVQDVRT